MASDQSLIGAVWMTVKQPPGDRGELVLRNPGDVRTVSAGANACQDFSVIGIHSKLAVCVCLCVRVCVCVCLCVSVCVCV